MRHIGSILIALCLTACDAQPLKTAEQKEVAKSSGAVDSEVRPLKEFMGHVIQRNAEQLWAWSEEISDANGFRSLAPKSDADWLNAESDAMTMAELASIIGSPAYTVDAKWTEFSARLLQVTNDASTAAEKRDFQRFSAASSAINDACVACHLHYVPELEGVKRDAVPKP
jgi:hypothetical protein